MPLTVAPGAIALTRTPAGINSTAAEAVRPTTACFAAVYACGPRPPRTPAVLAVFTIEPEPCARMTRAPCLIPRNTLVSRIAMAPVPVGAVGVDERTGHAEHTRVIEQAIQAPELRDGIVDHSSDVSLVAHVSLQEPGSGAQRPRYGSAPVLTHVGEDALCAFAGHTAGDALPDSAGRAGDNCNLAVEPCAHRATFHALPLFTLIGVHRTLYTSRPAEIKPPL